MFGAILWGLFCQQLQITSANFVQRGKPVDPNLTKKIYGVAAIHFLPDPYVFTPTERK